jgi:hypothetical protein
VAMPAPPTYRIENGIATILRAPIGFYLMPATLGRVFGLRTADWFLYLWALAGVSLFLLQVFASERRWPQLACIAALVVLYSGMDIWTASKSSLMDITSYKQWWAYPLFSYPSNTTALFWAPNHALPAWLGIALIYRCQDDARFLKIAAWVGALTLLWSPLVSIGLLPFFVALAWRHWRAGSWRPLLSLANLLAATPVALPVALYLTASAGTIGPAAGAHYEWLYRLRIYGLFVLLEFLILAMALLRAHRAGIHKLFFPVAVIVLLLLPLFSFGPFNDLAARASAPALLIIMFAAADGWARPLRLWGKGALVSLLLLIGAMAPLSEIARAMLWQPWQLNLQRSLYEASDGGHSPNYLARLAPPTLLARLLRPPVQPP